MKTGRIKTGTIDRLNVRAHNVARLLIFVLLLADISTVFGQQGVTSATLTGTVEDASGAAVSGATVEVTNLEKNQASKTTSDSHGHYRLTYLPAGVYRLTVEREGFATTKRQLVLSLGQTIDLNLRLSVATLAEQIEINVTDVPIVESARTQVAETIVSREIDVMPLNGRNYLDLALLAPAVSRTNVGASQRFAETSAVPGSGISIAGQRNLHNGFVVDGLSANDDAAGLAGSFYSQEVIREFQVVTTGGIAEFGRASSGVINIITQSGTNNWRGRLYGFLRDDRLDARNPLATGKDPLTQHQFGISAGGPLRRDRTFLFSNFERTLNDRTGFITISPTNVTAVNNILNSVNYPGARIETGEFATGFDTTNFFSRIDHRLNESTQLSTRYSLYDVSSENSRNVGGLGVVSRGVGLENRDQTVAIGLVSRFSTKAVNEARFQFTRSRLAAPVNDEIGPAVNISGVANFGTATFSPTARAIDLYEVVDNVSAYRGAHTLKGGVDFLYNRVAIEFPGAIQGAYTFSSLQNFESGRYITYQQAFGETNQRQSNPNIGLFFQDEWRPRNDLTVNAGLRYDLQWIDEPVTVDADNLAPRIGVAYAPGDRRTVVRASFGLFYDRVPLRAVSNALQRDGIKYKVAVLPFGQPGAPVFPNSMQSFPSGVLTSITTIDPDIENGSGEQASLQIEREIDRTTSLSIGYQYLRGLHIIMSRNVNVPTLSGAEAAALGIANLGRPNPNFANIGRFESAGDSYYNGMTVSLNKRASRWASMRVSYTLSKAIDNAGNFFFSSPQNNSDIRDDRGLSDNDQRHRLTVSGFLEVPRNNSRSMVRRLIDGFQLSSIFLYTSALPYNVQTGNDRNNDTSVNDRPIGVGRNTGRGFNFASLDMRVTRRFSFSERLKLEAMVEGFNVLNRSNFQLPNNVFGSGIMPLASFGRATAAGDPRQIQVGVRLSF
jgi:hypothetical protein